MEAPAYRVVDLVKHYPGVARPANDRLSFDIGRGEIFGILGENGAGKTTLVRQMVNLLRPTSGRIELLGRVVDRTNPAVPLHVGYMPQHGDALNRLTVEEALYFTAHLRGLSRAEAVAECHAQLACWDLGAVRRQDNATLSGGQRRLLRLAVALCARPEVVLLDEPTAGLDPARKRRVWQTLRQLNASQGTTIVLITHDALEAEKVVDRVGILRAGGLVALGRPAELKAVVGRQLRVELSFAPERPPRLPAGLLPADVANGRVVLHLEWQPAMELLAQLRPEELEDVRVSMSSLEDVVVHHAESA